MGTGITYQCVKCGYKKAFYTGIGFGLPEEYRKLVYKIRNGEFGEEWKHYFETHPGAAINADRELYQCPSCNHLVVENNLALYEHKNGLPPEDGYWMKTDNTVKEYKFIKSRSHKCQRCGKRMHILHDYYRPYPCPECGSDLKPVNLLLWD